MSDRGPRGMGWLMLRRLICERQCCITQDMFCLPLVLLIRAISCGSGNGVPALEPFRVPFFPSLAELSHYVSRVDLSQHGRTYLFVAYGSPIDSTEHDRAIIVHKRSKLARVIT